MAGEGIGPWWARGLIFENCNCQLICPGHVHFDQSCTHQRCVGYWAVDVREGDYDGTSLAGVRAIVAYDSPPRMIDGDWTQVIIVDETADAAQRAAIETVLNGSAGGPWAKLAPFASHRLPTRVAPIEIEDTETVKRVSVPGVLQSVVEAIRGRDRTRPVRFENMFNQIHPPSQVIARGSTRYDDGTIRVTTEGTHGLWSRFDWAVT